MNYKLHDRVSESEPVSSDLPYYLKEKKVGFLCNWLESVSLSGVHSLKGEQGMVLNGRVWFCRVLSLKQGIQFHYLPS